MHKIGNINVSITSADIASMAVDAITVPEFQHCALQSGIGKSVTQTYPKGMRMYDAYAKAVGFSLGNVFATQTGLSTCKHLLHAVIIGCCREDAFACVKTTTEKALFMADRKGARTIAIPTLGVGLAGCLTVEQSAKAILGAIADFEPLAANITRIKFVVPASAVQQVETILLKQSYLNCEQELAGKKFNLGEWIYTLCNQLNTSIPEVGC